MDYTDLVIRLSMEAPHHFVATAFEDGKSVASNFFELRLDQLKVMERLKQLEKTALGNKSKETFHVDFGQDLYRKVLTGNLGRYFKEYMAGNSEALRISLQFEDSASDLAALPWEFLHDGEDFMVARRNIIISRMPSHQSWVHYQPLESILRMLVVISTPEDPSCAPLNIEVERDRILEAVDKLYVEHKLEIDFTDDATFETIQSYLNEKEYHIVHFTGHGSISDGQSYLVLETVDHCPHEVDAQTVSDLFSNRGIRLVVLNACESAGLANKLAIMKIPAVIAMQYSILDTSANRFASAFYQAIANGSAVDLSLAEARIAMRKAENSNGVDFATPVLYLLDPQCLDVSSIITDKPELFMVHTMLGEVQIKKNSFVGRQKELLTLQKWFTSNLKRVVVIHGWGGIGKTALATRLAMRMANNFEGVFGFKFSTNTRPQDVLYDFNTFLEKGGISTSDHNLSPRESLQISTASMVAILNQRRFLVILDNFESCLDENNTHIADPNLRWFLEHLLNDTGFNSKFIITSRYKFDPLLGQLGESMGFLSVPDMPFHQAIWLMNNYSELSGLSVRWGKKRIYNAIGGHPWAIGMFAKHASEDTVDSLLQKLEPLKRELNEFTLFDMSYSKLNEESKKLLLSASVLMEAVPYEVLSWMMGDEMLPSPSIDHPLEEVVAWGLMAIKEEPDEIQYPDPVQRRAKEPLYSMHTLVRDFVNKNAKEQNMDTKNLLIRVAQYYENKAKIDKIAWNFLRARDYYYQAEEWEKASEIVIGIWMFLDRWGYWDLAKDLLNQSIDTTSGNTRAFAKGNLGIVYHNLGDLDMAIKLHNEVIHEMEDDKKTVAATMHELGIIYREKGDYSEAIKHNSYSMSLFMEIDDKENVAKSMHELGIIYQEQDNYAEAIKQYQQSLNLFKEINDKYSIAKVFHQLGIVSQLSRDFSQANDYYRDSLAVCKEIDDRQGIASSLYQLGNLCIEQGDISGAIRFHEKSLDIKIDLKDKGGIARSYYSMGVIHKEQGNFPEAIKYYQKSLRSFEMINDKKGIANSLYRIGELHEEEKNYSAALPYYARAFSIFNELEDPTQEIVKISYDKLMKKIGESSLFI